ncbi:MAG TPA: response regulator transcription factor [Gaiellaceae bacterium]|jgi:DNA-binding response OmpR family regulator|nr:response regulator transcription factor [Gaiellaceae bacterium]
MSYRRILVVDDDPDIRGLLRVLLDRRGFAVTEARDGQEALRAFYTERPDLVVLDVAMPVLDGWKTLERIRELSDVPVVMLTAKADELEKTRGLRAGADDYVTKPFGRQELLARVEGLLRRAGARAAEQETYSDAFLTIDFSQRTVTARGEPVDLTPLEFRLLTTFVRHPNHVLTHEQLLELVWGDPHAAKDQVKLYVGYLRKKLCPDEPESAPIETRRGFGYCYRPAR